MKYRDLCGERVSLLGFGAMRFPTTTVNGKREVDFAETERLVDFAIGKGLNYFDTAHPYHRGESERIIGKILSKYPRESFYLADKFPGHQIMSNYDVRGIFAEQLEKCGVEYFDFYLLHNVCDTTLDTYLDERWGIVDYLLEEKKRGRIKHLGFSTHATVECLEKILEHFEGKLEFCQIQLNYLDYTLQRANEKLELLKKYNMPVIVMEPVRGGKLASLNEYAESKMREYRPDESVASWCFRWLEEFSEVSVVLSGMSDMAQVKDNLKTYSGGEPLSAEERALLSEIAEALKKSVPCTACRYCTDGCPAGLDIPELISVYNDLAYQKSTNTAIRVEFLPEDKKPSACIGCGKCSEICPQKIDIPKTLADLTDMIAGMRSWRDICKEREEDAHRQRANEK